MTQPLITPAMADIRKGLDGVIADETKISKVIADKQYLTYRGYPVPELADRCDFIEIAHLILHGELPNAAQYAEFESAEKSARALTAQMLSMIALYPRDAHPMRMMQTAIAFLGQQDADAEDNAATANHRKAIRILAQMPTIVAACMRHVAGQPPIAPSAQLGYSENFFQMCFGHVPAPGIVKSFDASMTLYAEHGFNASTFSARVIVSSLSDMHSALSGAVGSLKGPLHGGANEAVMHMLLDVGDPARAKNWMMDALATKKKIMGFGHRLYKKGDSRVPCMKKYRDMTAAATGGQKWVAMSDILEQFMIAEKNIYPNLDFPAGPAYYMMGFPIPFFTPIFVMSRVTGWAAHVIEQLSSNKLIRPVSHYTGFGERAITPMAQRG